MLRLYLPGEPVGMVQRDSRRREEDDNGKADHGEIDMEPAGSFRRTFSNMYTKAVLRWLPRESCCRGVIACGSQAWRLLSHSRPGESPALAGR
jgi:hypothetical protein